MNNQRFILKGISHNLLFCTTNCAKRVLRPVSRVIESTPIIHILVVRITRNEYPCIIRATIQCSYSTFLNLVFLPCHCLVSCDNYVTNSNWWRCNKGYYSSSTIDCKVSSFCLCHIASCCLYYCCNCCSI